MAPKWFDKNRRWTNDDNFEQLRDVLRLARDAYVADPSPDTAFGHFARHHDAHQAAAAARRPPTRLVASYGPALVDRAVLDGLCRALGMSFYAAAAATWSASRRTAHPISLDSFGSLPRRS